MRGMQCACTHVLTKYMERTMCTLAAETSVFVLVGLRLVYIVSANWENLTPFTTANESLFMLACIQRASKY